MTADIAPVLLCGGSGERLWPLSRPDAPKQFAGLAGDLSLFQATVRRLAGPGFLPPTVLTLAPFRRTALAQMAAVGASPGALLIEPARRNTGPAALAAALLLAADDPDRLMLLAPTDHAIADAAAFRAAVELGAAAARDGALVAFGVGPDRAETGYGYLELPGPPVRGAVVKPKRFVEKPDAAAAAEMLAAGTFLWNAGVFLGRAGAFVRAFETHAPGLLAPARAALDLAKRSGRTIRLDPAAWADADDISIDYAVMERVDNLLVAPVAAGWNDLGGWESVWRDRGPDGDGVASVGPATAVDCRDSLLWADDPSMALVGLGLDDIVAVATADAVLVARKSRAQDVREAVEALRAAGAPQVIHGRRATRGWGSDEALGSGEGYAVRRLVLDPGASLDLAGASGRACRWIVAEGAVDAAGAVATGEAIALAPGESVRVRNRSATAATLVAVETAAPG